MKSEMADSAGPSGSTCDGTEPIELIMKMAQELEELELENKKTDNELLLGKLERAEREHERLLSELKEAKRLHKLLMTNGHERPEDDSCPICDLPFPHDASLWMYWPCCMKKMCKGCVLKSYKHGIDDCPFCRGKQPKDKGQFIAMVQKRADTGDPEAICYLGAVYREGRYGLKADNAMAKKMLTKAAELGVKFAHLLLGQIYYCEGESAKMHKHWVAAAISGDVYARHQLGCMDYDDENYGRAVQHWKISAKMGLEGSLNAIKDLFLKGHATKMDYAEALRGYQSAAEEMKSPERREASLLPAGDWF